MYPVPLNDRGAYCVTAIVASALVLSPTLAIAGGWFGKVWKPFERPLTKLPATGAESKPNQELLNEMKDFGKRPSESATNDAQISKSSSWAAQQIGFRGKEANEVVLPAVAHFQSGASAGTLSVATNGELLFQDKESSQELRLEEDLRLRAIPTGYPIAFGIEKTADSGDGKFNYIISKAKDAFKPFASQFWDVNLVKQLGSFPASQFSAITAASNNVKDKFNLLTEASAKRTTTLAQLAALQEEVAKAEIQAIRVIGNVYRQIPENQGWVRQWLAANAAVHEQGNKAINGTFVDNYDPEVYEIIGRVTRACGAVQISGFPKALVSAVLIGEDTILTCQHDVVQKWESKALEGGGANKTKAAVFLLNREKRRRITYDGDPIPILDLLHKGDVYVNSSEHQLDFAVFRIDRNALIAHEERIKTQCEKAAIPYFPIMPVVLAESMPDYFNPLFVVGHSGGDRKLVHDSAHLLFPSRIDPDLLTRMYMTLEHSLLQKESSLQSERKRAFKAFLEKRYLPISASGDNSRMYVNKYGVPVFGLDSDTFGGDSGGPVFDRFTGMIVGVFKGSAFFFLDEEEGPPDARHVPAGKPGDFDHHENGVPITAIIEQLDTMTDRKWREDLKGLRFGSTVLSN
jgi:Trypsin-like peptidase domain